MIAWATLLAVAVALPIPGTRFKELPEGKGRQQVESACYACHSADLIAQQRLTEKQWTATVDKMIRWGAAISPGDRSIAIGYLSRNFGPDHRFRPTAVRPIRSKR